MRKNDLIGKYNHLSENNKIVFRNIIGTFIIKGLSLSLSLFTMPTYIRFFNDNISLGLWFTIVSVLSWILNFDMGIGNGLRNHLTRAFAKNDYLAAKKYLSSAYISIGILCVCISILFSFTFDLINWNLVFKIKESVVSSGALLITVKIVFIGIVSQMFLRLITSVLYAVQKSFINNFISLLTSIITIVLVILTPSRNNDYNMIIMAIIHVFAITAPLICVTIVLFCRGKLKKCIPSIKYFSKNHSKEVLSLGSTFLFIQVMYMFIMNTNEYLITIFDTNESVVSYQIYFKLFSLGGMIFGLAMTPIWSAVTKSLVEKNYIWIKKINKNLLLISFIGLFMEFSLIPFVQIFINFWLKGNAIYVNFYHTIPFAFMGSLIIFNSALSSIANGLGQLKVQFIFFGIGAIVKIPLAWVLINIFNSWIGVVWANVIVLALYCIVQSIVTYKYLNKKTL